MSFRIRFFRSTRQVGEKGFAEGYPYEDPKKSPWFGPYKEIIQSRDGIVAFDEDGKGTVLARSTTTRTHMLAKTRAHGIMMDETIAVWTIRNQPGAGHFAAPMAPPPDGFESMDAWWDGFLIETS